MRRWPKSILLAALLVAGTIAGPVASAEAATLPRQVDTAWYGEHRTIAPGSPAAALTSIGCAQTTFCLAVGDRGTIVWSEQPDSDTGVWASASIADQPNFVDVACPSTDLCVALDSQSRIWSSSAPRNPVTWHAVSPSGASTLTSVACPAVNLCLVGDAGGHVYTSTQPTGAAGVWHASALSGALAIRAVDCVSTTFCIAVGPGIRVSFSRNPAAGNWSQPDKFAIDAGSGAAGSCTPGGSCFIGTPGSKVRFALFDSATNVSWSPRTLSQGVTAFDCASADSCFAIDATGAAEIESFSDYGGGTTGLDDEWRAAFGGSFQGDVACVQEFDCLIVDQLGRLTIFTVRPPKFFYLPQLTIKPSDRGPGRFGCSWHISDLNRDANGQPVQQAQMLVDGTVVAATDLYEATSADIGHSIACRVTGSNAVGTVSAQTEPYVMEAPVPTPTTTPSPGPSPAPSPQTVPPPVPNPTPAPMVIPVAPASPSPPAAPGAPMLMASPQPAPTSSLSGGTVRLTKLKLQTTRKTSPAKVEAEIAAKRRTQAANLRPEALGTACVVSGVIKLKGQLKSVSMVRVEISGKGIKTLKLNLKTSS